MRPVFKKGQNTKTIFVRKLFTAFLSLTLLLNLASPALQLSYADENSAEPTVTEEQAQPTADPTSTEIAPQNEEATTTPELTQEETITPTPSEEPTTASPTPVDNLSPPTSSDNNPPESETSAQLAPAVWQTNSDGSATTTNVVSLDQTYKAPQNDKVKITFTKLPDPSDKLTVREVKLSSEQQDELSALSDTAYEFTSPMADGTFEYDLTLPLPQNVNKDDVAVKSAESTDELGNAQTLGEPKEIASETITIKGLNHFTVFVLVNDDNTGDADSTNDVANGSFTAIDDTFADQENPNGTNGGNSNINVRSKSGDDNRRGFVKFDTSSIVGGSEITKATLRLFLNNAPAASRTYEAYRITAGWAEGSLTWNNQPVVAAGASSSVSTGTSDNVWREWDVTSDVQNFVNGVNTNYGWMIKDSSEDSSTSRQGQLNSSENSNELRRPQLVVDFAVPDDQPTKFKSPADSVGGIGGDNDGFESNPINALSDGAGVASNIDGASDRHVFRDYYFEIPTDAVVNGIEVRTDWRLDATGGTNSLDVDLSWDGGASWTTAKSDITETNKEHIASLGGANDTWGREWSAGEFANENFKVRTTTNSTDPNRDFYLDWIPVRVYYTEPEEDITPPVSEFTSPAEGSFWNTSIDIQGSSTDVPDTTVDYVRLFYRESVEEDGDFVWIEIDTVENTEGDEPFNWNYDWEPEVEGAYDIMAEATDTAGNTELSPVVEEVTYDVTEPVVTDISISPDPTNHPPSILALATDLLSRIASAIFQVDDETFSDPITLPALDGVFDSLSENLFIDEYNTMPYPGEGLHTLYVGAYDFAGNFGYNFASFTVDTTAPTLESTETQDTNGNGKIDAIKLTFSENIDDSLLDEGNPDGWDVVGYDGEAIGTGEGENDNELLLAFDEGESFDTGATPVVTYTPFDGGGGPSSTHDTAGNELESYEASADDKALPVLLSAFTRDTDTNGQIDALEFTFSEDIDDNMLDDSEFADGDGWDVDGYSDEVISTGENENDNILLLTFSESGSSDTGATPNVSYTSSEDEDTSTHDMVGNELASGEWSTSDGAPPLMPVADPTAGDYLSDQSVTLTSSDDGGTGLDAIYYTTDGTDPDNTSTEYTVPIAIGVDTTLKAIAYDNAGNASGILEAVYGIAPIISNEVFTRLNDTSLTVTWTTDDPATSRVVYDTVSHEPAVSSGDSPFDKYGYANTTGEFDTGVNKTTSHSVTITGLSTGTTYYYRMISHGSPEAVGSEHNFTVGLLFGSSGTGDGLGCATNDCSGGGGGGGAAVGGGAPAGGAVFGVAVGPFIETGVLGETTPSATLSPSPTEKGVLGNVPSEKVNYGNLAPKLIYLLLFLIPVGFWLYLKKKKKDEK